MKRMKFYQTTEDSLRLGLLLAMVGGYLDAYTFVGRGGVFANAQTGNIVLLGIYAAQGRWMQALLVVPPIIAFVVGVVVAESIKKFAAKGVIYDWAQGVLLLEMIILTVVGFVPASVPNLFVTVTISFIASVQVSSFRTLVDSPYSSTMCTGNLRIASKALYEAVTQHEPAAARRAGRFYAIILAFLVGAIAGGIFTDIFNERSVWAAVIILAASFGMLFFDKRKQNRVSV
jgi:uncharacterized membrane protein YoaK (UPF0700 family)